MGVDVAHELAAIRSELAGVDDAAPALGAVARLAELAGQLEAPAVQGARTLPERDDRLLLEGVRGFAARAHQAGAPEDAPRCWFGVSAEDGLPWMYCATAGVARQALAILERLAAARGQGV